MSLSRCFHARVRALCAFVLLFSAAQSALAQCNDVTGTIVAEYAIEDGLGYVPGEQFRLRVSLVHGTTAPCERTYAAGISQRVPDGFTFVQTIPTAPAIASVISFRTGELEVVWTQPLIPDSVELVFNVDPAATGTKEFSTRVFWRGTGTQFMTGPFALEVHPEFVEEGEGESTATLQDYLHAQALLGAFTVADSDGSGALTLLEMASIVGALLPRLITLFDLDGDGMLSTAELIAVTSSEVHSADLDEDYHLGLEDLLRVIQLYNFGSFQCHPDTGEDGFMLGAGDILCLRHSSDYEHNWSIGFSELLRAIQFFNSTGYSHCPESLSEDGYCIEE